MTRRSFLLGIDGVLQGRPGVAVAVDVAANRVLMSQGLARAGVVTAAPGSTVKPFALQALVEGGLLPANPALACDPAFGCTHPPLTRALDPVAALAYSCNAWFARMGARLDAGEFQRRLERLGFGARTGWTGRESTGEIAAARTPEELQRQVLGLGGVTVTPLGLASAYRKLALRRRENPPGLQCVFEGLESAVRYGTAQQAQARGIQVAGKTGTAGSGAWFAGYAPAGKPAVVVVAFLEQGRGGSDAAPVAAQVFEAWASGR
jgi:cell division protein FtsI/penicillin-binding protein 2